MSKRSDITGKGPSYGNNIPFSKKKTRRRWDSNLHDKRIWVPELNRFVKLRLSTRDMRSIDRQGLVSYMKKQGKSLTDLA